MAGQGDRLGAADPATIGRPTGRRDGLLLLLAALALVILVVASSVLLRQLTRLQQESYEGPAA